MITGPIERALPPGLCRARHPMGCSFGKPTPSLAFARLAANWVCKTAEGTGVPSCPGYRKAAGTLGLMPHGFPEDLRSKYKGTAFACRSALPEPAFGACCKKESQKNRQKKELLGNCLKQVIS